MIQWNTFANQTWHLLWCMWAFNVSVCEYLFQRDIFFCRQDYQRSYLSRKNALKSYEKWTHKLRRWWEFNAVNLQSNLCDVLCQLQSHFKGLFLQLTWCRYKFWARLCVVGFSFFHCNPLEWVYLSTPRSDKHVTSPYYINTLSRKRVMRRLKFIWKKLWFWSESKFWLSIFKVMCSR